MAARIKLKDRILPKYTTGEEIFNMVTHIVGGGIGIITLVVCVVISAMNKSAAAVLSSVAFGGSMIILYTMSSIYHGLRTDTSKKVFQIIDHCSIYFLIAGTYTPVLVVAFAPVNPVAAWVTFGAVWGLAVIATVLTAIDLKKYKTFSMICYIGMGWSVIFSIKSVYEVLTFGGFALLFGGGLFYTVGVIFYKLGKRKKYFHSIFHIFVLMGSILQAISIIFFVLL